MSREIKAIPTKFDGILYRSRTEARWAVFLKSLGVQFDYEPEGLKLPSGAAYLPDFYIHDFEVYLEVKPDSTEIAIKETEKGMELARESKGKEYWIVLGSPHEDSYNVFPLGAHEHTVESLVRDPSNGYRILEDRRDEKIYWVERSDGSHHRSLGGPGIPSDHSRYPLLHQTVKEAYLAAREIDFTKPQV